MSTKFVYHNNGKITRTDLSGIPIMSTKGVSALSASNDGNYIIVKSGDTYSFEPSTAGLSAVTPGNLTNITPNNKNYLLAIGSDNNFKQILFNNNSINNTFSYVNDQWILDKKGLFEQYAETQDDAVIIAGKGADAYQIVNGEHTPYAGDLQIAKKYLD